MKKFLVKDFIKKDGKQENIEFELQEMDSLDFYDLQTSFKMGQIKFSDYAKAVIKECIASPAEARDIKFFKNEVDVLDKLTFQCGLLSNAGFLEKKKLEIITE